MNSRQELQTKFDEARDIALARVVKKYDQAYVVSYLTRYYILQADFDLAGLFLNARWTGHDYYRNAGEMACVWGRVVADARAMDETRLGLTPLPWEV